MRMRLVVISLCAAAGCHGDSSPAAPDSRTPGPFTPVGPVLPRVTVPSTVVLNQLDVTFDDGAHTDSPWGEALVSFTGSGGALYFNLVVDGVWRIQNMPVLSRDGAGVAQTTALLFDLGVGDGTDVTSADVVWDLNTDPLAAAPAGAAVVTGVGARSWAINTGIRGKAIEYAPPPAVQQGGQAIGNKATHRDFPNQQADMNECVPVALSNSLQWLNATFGLGLTDAQVSVAAMKVVTKWTARGAPQQWWGNKRRAFKDLIETRTIPKRSIDKLHAAVAKGCDVELEINHHVVAVTGSQKLADGKFALDLTHDPDQKDGAPPGAEGTQTVTYDPRTNKFSGAPWVQGRGAFRIVSECSKRQT